MMRSRENPTAAAEDKIPAAVSTKGGANEEKSEKCPLPQTIEHPASTHTLKILFYSVNIFATDISANLLNDTFKARQTEVI